MKKVLLTLTIILVATAFFITMRDDGRDADRILELEAQVSTLQEKNNEFANYAVGLQEQLATLDHNNRVIKIVDRWGILNDKLVLGPAYIVLDQQNRATQDGIRNINTLLEAEGDKPLWIYDYATEKKIFPNVYPGETIFLNASPANAEGEVFLQYSVCYTNNDFSCISEVVLTTIRLK